MTWHFEWNWLGYLWAFLIGGGLLMVAMMFLADIVAMIKTGKSEQGASMMAGFITMITVSNAFLLGVLTIFVWDFKSALWLAGGALASLALIFGVAYLSMRLVSR